GPARRAARDAQLPRCARGPHRGRARRQDAEGSGPGRPGGRHSRGRAASTARAPHPPGRQPDRSGSLPGHTALSLGRRRRTGLRAGKAPAQVAYATATATAPLDALQRRQVDEMLHERMPRMDGAGVKAWRAEVADAAGELDPDGAARRHLAARKNRHVTFTPAEHGMATVSAHLPALDAKLAHKRLSLEAERRRAGGARDGHGALMADAFTDTVLGREGGMEPVTLDLGVMITD